jgi:hypothetical protein
MKYLINEKNVEKEIKEVYTQSFGREIRKKKFCKF